MVLGFRTRNRPRTLKTKQKKTVKSILNTNPKDKNKQNDTIKYEYMPKARSKAETFIVPCRYTRTDELRPKSSHLIIYSHYILT